MRPIPRGLAVLGTTLILAACSGGGTSTTAPTSAAATSGSVATSGAGATTAAGGAPCADGTGTTTVQATVADFTWMPANVMAKVGDVITWTNSDSAPHQVGLDDGSCQQSKSIPGGGGTGSLTFSQAGTFPFHCTIHPTMKGTITIT